MLKILALHAALTLGGAVPALEVDTILRVSRGSRLDLEVGVQQARIEIRAWDRDEVSVQSAAPVRVSMTGAVVRVGSPQPPARQRTTYEIRVPAWMPLNVNGTMADVTIEGAGGDVSVETVMGTIRITGGDGRVAAKSMQGSVTIEGARGRIEAFSANQGVRISDASGQIQAETLNGSVRLEGIESSDVLATSTNGNIEFDGPIRSDGRYRLTTHNGRVTVGVQEGANATVTVSTYNGRYTSSFPVSITETGPDRRYTFVIGTGSARIEASSFNGNIEFRRPGR
jgi:DUF4097 and DUF4098 domain-containing protein YvlB